MRGRILLTAFALLVLTGAFTALTDSSYADVSEEYDEHIRIAGDYTLTEDRTFGDKTEITILGKTTIDLSTYTLDFGNESKIIIIGSLVVSSNNGSMIVGEKTSLVMIGVAIPGFDERITYTFDGELMFDKDLIRSGETGIKYQPHGQDPALHMSWANTTMAVCDPALSIGIISEGLLEKGIEAKIRFSTADIHIDNYEEEVLISTEDTHVETNNSYEALDIVIMAREQPVIQSVDINKVESVNRYQETDVKTVSIFDDIGPTKITMDENKIQTVSTHVSKMTSERYIGDELRYRENSNNVSVTFEADPSVLVALIMPTGGDGKVLTDILRYLEVTIESVDMYDYDDQEQRHLGDIVIKVDNIDAEASIISMTMVDIENQDSYDIKVSKVSFNSFDMSKNLVINTDMFAEHMRIDKDSQTQPYNITLESISVKASNLNIKELYSTYCRTGTMEIQQLLDNCDRLEVGFGLLEYDDGEGEDADVKVYDGLGLLCVDTRGQNTGTFSFSNLQASIAQENDLIEMELQNTRLYVESNGSLTECLNAFTKGINFTTDAHSQIQLTNDGIDLKYTRNDDTMEVHTGKVSPSSTSLSVVVTIDHSTYQNATMFKFDISSIGYNINVLFHNKYDDPEGTSDIALHTTDLTGSVDFTFGDSISFKADLNTPWSVDFNYYDIEFQAEGKDMVLGLNHSDLVIDGYDYTEQGFFDMFKCLSENNFTLSCRISFSEEHITIYKEQRTILYDQYDDVELDIRELFVDLVLKEHRNVSLDKLHLSLVYSNGSTLDRTVRHLDVFKDLSDPDNSRPFFEDFATYMTVTSAVISAVMILAIIGLRIRNPEMFKFRE